MKKILIYFLINIIGLILIIIGCLGILWKLWENYGLLFIFILLSIIYILIGRDRRFDVNFFNDSDMGKIQQKFKPYNRIILLFYGVFHGLLYIYIIEMPIIIQDIYGLSIIMQVLFIGHVLILNWLYMVAENYNKNKIKFIISRISVLTSGVGVVLLMKQILMIIEMIGYYYEVLEDKTKKSYGMKKIWKFLDILICQIFFILIFNISYISSVFNEYSKLLIGYNLNFNNISLISEVNFNYDSVEGNLYNHKKFNYLYYFIIFIFIILLLFITKEPRLYMIYFIVMSVNYYYTQIKHKIEHCLKNNDLLILSSKGSSYTIFMHYVKYDNYIVYSDIIIEKSYSSAVRSTTYYDSGLNLDYLVFFLDSKTSGFNIIEGPVLQKFNVFDIFRFFIYDINGRNKMVAQRYGTFDKGIFLFIRPADHYMNKHEYFKHLIQYFIVYYRLDINIDDFLVLARWDLDEYSNYIIVRYPVEFVNVENITLGKYLTKEEGYYDFVIKITDNNGSNFRNYKRTYFDDIIFLDDLI